MQRYCTELTERLLKSLDKEYNVVDMGAVVDVITALEKTTITKEVLEITRLGKYINELRRKTSNDALAKRAKDLVRRWRDMVLPSAHTTPQPTPADTAPQALNGTKPQSPALRGLKPHSPALRGLKPHSPALKNLKPHSPLMRDTTPLKQVLSPALSLHSDHSRSPNPTPTKQQQQQQQQHPAPPPTSSAPAAPPPPPPRVPNPSNHRLNPEPSPKLGSVSTQNHSVTEAVPRTHSSNKRLRKEEASPAASPQASPPQTSVKSIRGDSNDSLASRLEAPSAKRPRLNGELGNFASLSKFTESYASNNNLVASRGLNQVPGSPRESSGGGVGDKSERCFASLSDVSTSVENSRDAADAATPAGPKKRGRKKGSKSLKGQSLPEDRVKEKLASISRNPKLKTTQELLADLQARGCSSLAAGGTTTTPRGSEPPSTEEILRSAAAAGNDDRPLSSRFLRSSGRERSSSSSLRGSTRSTNFGDAPRSRGKTGGDARPEEAEENTAGSKELTVEEILAKLPPLDLDAISWSDCEEEAAAAEEEEEAEDAVPREIRPEDVDRLHEECVEGLNGNFQAKLRVSRDDGGEAARVERVEDIRNSDAWSIAELKKKGVYRRLGGNEDDREFREWHEMLARPSYDGQTLHILPYVIID